MPWRASRIEIGSWPATLDMGGTWIRNCEQLASFVLLDFVWIQGVGFFQLRETYDLTISDGGFDDALQSAAGAVATIADWLGAAGLANAIRGLSARIPGFDGTLRLEFVGIGLKKPCRGEADDEDRAMGEQAPNSYPVQSVGWGLVVTATFTGTAVLGGSRTAVSGWLPLGPVAEEWEHCACAG